MIPIDDRIDRDRLELFASNAQHLQPGVRHVFAECLLMDQPPEFYFGLISALMFTHQLLEGQDCVTDEEVDGLKKKQQVIAGCLSLVCEQVVSKGWAHLLAANENC